MSYGKPPREPILVIGVEPRELHDPGDGEVISAAGGGGYCRLVTAGAETRILADPTARGQVFDLFFDTDGGDCTITAASPINQAGNNTLTFSDVGEHIRLIGHENLTDGWEWRVACNDGVALSTV